jgi:hypothetical protein
MGIAEVVEALRPLAWRYKFNPYRNYRVFSRRAQTDILLAELVSIASLPDAIVDVRGPEDSGVAVIARRLAWESAFFGLPMARIACLLGGEATARHAALNGCIDRIRQSGVRHISALTDAADVETAVLLERLGFRMTGGTVTYIARPRKDSPRLLRKLGNVRNLEPGDGQEVIAIAEEAFRGFKGRFHMDPSLPRSRVEALYTEWTRRCVSYEMADRVLVSEGRNGRLLGFIAVRRREPISTNSGVPIFGSGLAACRRDAPGAYFGLLHHIVTWAHEQGGVPEAQTQNYNFPALAAHEAVGLRFTRADYHFALSLD